MPTPPLPRVRRVAGPLVLVGLIGLLLGRGCVDPGATDQPQTAIPTDRSGIHPGSPPPLPAQPDNTQVVDLSLGQLPLRFPDAQPAQESTADDVATEEPERGLVNTLRQIVQGSPVFEESGVQVDLTEDLSIAHQTMSRAKRQNRDALRQANRQVQTLGRVPNLVLISVDELPLSALGCYGHQPSITPHIDELASKGVRFEQAYAGSASARAAQWCLNAGLNSGRATADEQGNRFTLGEVRDTLAETLWQAGYSTGFVGLWTDPSLPVDHGYDEWTGFRSPEEATEFPAVIYFDATKATILQNRDGGREVSGPDFLVGECLSFVARQAASGRPFFLHVSAPRFVSAAGAAEPSQRWADLDTMVGRIDHWLTESRLASQTCVVLMGETAGSEPVADGSAQTFKRSRDGLAEGNLRVPLIVAWPDHVTAGRSTRHVCAAWDLLPTFADLAFARRRPAHLDGLSFAPTLLGRPQRDHTLLYWETRDEGFGQAVRKGAWKGVRHVGSQEMALYNLDEDPQEQADLAATRPDVVEQLVVRRR